MFEHSIRVPRHFKIASNIVKKVSEEGGSVKTLLYDNKLRHFRTSVLYALINETIKHAAEIENIFKNSGVLCNEPRLDPWLAKVLTAELLFGKKTLPGKSKPEQTILSYKEKFQKICNEFQDESNTKVVHRPRYVRVNTNLLTTSDAIRAFQDEGYKFIRCTSGSYDDYLQQIQSLTEYDFTQDYHIKTIFVFFPGTKFHDHDLYLENKIILQDKATALPVHLLAPPPGSVVLDMCAAPGMKTTQLAAYLRNQGKIYAVERNEKRYETLCNYVEATGSKCVKTLQKDSLEIRRGDLDDVEYILLDPSCSGSGMELSVHNYIEDTRLAKLTSLQEKFLKHAMNAFPNAKRIVYSTCSIFPEENERVITNIVKASRAKWRVKDVKELLKGQWNNFGSGMYGSIGTRCLYAKPESDFATGFFLAVLDRDFRPSEKTECTINKLLNSDKESKLVFENHLENVNNGAELDVNENHKKDKREKNNLSHRNEDNHLNAADVPSGNTIKPPVTKKIKIEHNNDENGNSTTEYKLFYAKCNKCDEVGGVNDDKKKDTKKKIKKEHENLKYLETNNLYGVDTILETHVKRKKKHNVAEPNENNSTNNVFNCANQDDTYESKCKPFVTIASNTIKDQPNSKNILPLDERNLIEDSVGYKKTKKKKHKTHDDELNKNDELEDILQPQIISFESSVSFDIVRENSKIKRQKLNYDIKASDRDQLFEENPDSIQESKKQKKKRKAYNKQNEEYELFSDTLDKSAKHNDYANDTKKELLNLEDCAITSVSETIRKKKKKLKNSHDQTPTEGIHLLENKQENCYNLQEELNTENPKDNPYRKVIKKKKKMNNKEAFDISESNHQYNAVNNDSLRSPKKKKRKDI